MAEYLNQTAGGYQMVNEMKITEMYGPSMLWERKVTVRVGSVVRLRDSFSGKVIRFDEKNGRPLVDLGQRWAYVDQIERVVNQ
jgi:hypothetical protein